ncbi:MAG: 50S ribosomal protein L9 [Candidatus Marinimicrobia bacterium]|nr:50S ribosomal protein L9 [Candidatus Neomarinimicrobiota bacterium]
MRIILLKDHENLGEAGTQVEVKTGFARNYLIPSGIALNATKENLKKFEEIAKQKKNKLARALKSSQELAEKLKSLSLTVAVKVGEDDKIFGSVTTQMISEQLQEKGYDIDKRQIQLEEPIKALGIYDIPVRLHSEITTSVKLWVIKS